MPSHWGDFRLVAELGHGGFGRVYRAYDEGLATEVALKVVRADRSRAGDVFREGQMLARVRHPNVVTVHAVRQIGDEVGFVMELVDGESLAERVRRTGRLGADEATAIGLTVCHALAAVHGAGLLHRDVKARNVMRESGGRIVLMDFGAGRERSSRERPDDLTGTPLYFAPELLAGGTASPASDLYSVGVLLYFLVTGAFPVEGESASAIALAHAAGARRLLVDRRPDLPREFIRVVEKALTASPRQRYQSAGEMLADLEAIGVRHAAGSPAAPAPPVRPRWPAPAWVAVAVVAAMPVVIGLGFLATRAYDAAFGLERFADDSLGTWTRMGARALLPPAVFCAMAFGALLIARVIWLALRPAVPPLGRLTARVHASISTTIGRRLPRDVNVRARWLLLGQAIVLLALFVVFNAELSALITPFEHADPSVWQVLYYDANQLGRVNYYQMILPIAAMAMALGWRRLLRPPGAFGAVDKVLFGAGMAIVATLIVGVAVPFRVFYLAQDLPRYEVDGERCYEAARAGGEVKLFCPDVVPGPARSRTVILPATDPRLRTPLPPLSPYRPR